MEPYQRLANAIVVQAAMDYVHVLRLLKHHPENKTIRQKAREYEDFFHSGWYSMLTDVNPVYLIKELKKTV